MMRMSEADFLDALRRKRAECATSDLRALALLAGLVETGLAAIPPTDHGAEIEEMRRRLGSIVVDLETLARRTERAQR